MSNVILYLIFSVEEKSINKYLQKKVTSCIFSLYSQLILFAGILISVSGRISENCINFTLSFLEILFIEIRNSYGEPYLCLIHSPVHVIFIEFFLFRANFKSIGSLVLITCFFVRQNRFGTLIQTFSQKTAKNQISGRFPPLPSTRDVLDILLFTSA